MFANLMRTLQGLLFHFFEMLAGFSLYFHHKIATCVTGLSNFGLQKSAKIIKILYFLSNADVSNQFDRFQCFDKKMTNSMFFHPETVIKTKYKCQEEEKVETENSIQIQ